MTFTRRQTDDLPVSWEERDALARAEYLCDQAELLHLEARVAAERVVNEARAEAARLLSRAMGAIDEQLARSQASLRRQERHEAAVRSARAEADRLLESSRAAGWAVGPGGVDASADAWSVIDLREMADQLG